MQNPEKLFHDEREIDQYAPITTAPIVTMGGTQEFREFSIKS